MLLYCCLFLFAFAVVVAVVVVCCNTWCRHHHAPFSQAGFKFFVLICLPLSDVSHICCIVVLVLITATRDGSGNVDDDERVLFPFSMVSHQQLKKCI